MEASLFLVMRQWREMENGKNVVEERLDERWEKGVALRYDTMRCDQSKWKDWTDAIGR